MWVLAQSVRLGVWNDLYETALAHLFIAQQLADPLRDAANYEYFVSQQLPNGSWNNDPFLTALILRAMSLKANPETVTTGISLRVIDNYSGDPIPGVNVYGVVTDGNGQATIPAPPLSSLQISINAYGYTPKTVSYTSPASGILNVGDIRLTPTGTPSKIFGKVTDRITGAPIKGATLLFQDPVIGLRYTSTDINGQYVYATYATDSLYLEAEAAGYGITKAALRITVGAAHPVDLQLSPLVANDLVLQGLVTNKNTGEILKSGSVTLTYATLNRGLQTFTGNIGTDGKYRFDGLPARVVSETVDIGGGATAVINKDQSESYTMTITTSGYYNERIYGVQANSMGLPFNIKLTPQSVIPILRVNISVKAIDLLAGTSPNTGTLQLYSPDGTLTSGVLDASGAYSFQVTPNPNYAGRPYKLTTYVSGYQLDTQFINVYQSPVVQVNVNLTRQQSFIKGSLVDATTGTPIKGARIESNVMYGLVADDGIFKMGFSVEGMITFTITAPGYEALTRPVFLFTNGITDLGVIRLSKKLPKAEIGGRIYDVETNTAIVGAMVSADGVNTVSALNGQYTLSDLPPKRYDVRVVANGYEPTTVTVDALVPKGYSLDFKLKKIGSNAFKVSINADKATYGAYQTITTRTTITPPKNGSNAYLDVSL